MINHYHVDILSRIFFKKHLKYSARCFQGHWRSVPGKGVRDVNGRNVATQHGPCVSMAQAFPSCSGILQMVFLFVQEFM